MASMKNKNNEQEIVSSLEKKKQKDVCLIRRKLLCPRKIKQLFSITDECKSC